MTIASRLPQLGAAITAAVCTAIVFSGVLWAQHARDAWPFSPRADPPARVSPATGPAGDPAHAQARVPIEVTDATIQELGIAIEAARRESLTQSVRAVATIVPDESRISHVHSRVAGWIEELYVNTTGEMVRAGEPLARIFSQELLSSQAEYLSVRSATSSSGIASVAVASGRTRLMVLGMSPGEIDEIEQTGEPKRLVTVIAPMNGVVVNRGITVGT
jgi:Cu(I)/Ag(I) efflux system membrane fusion protein